MVQTDQDVGIMPWDQPKVFGHPKGLYVLFFTELWERFSFYGMRAILVLYMIASVAEGGLGWTNAEALALYGWYTMLVYVMSIPGGFIADRFLGQKKTVLLGGILLCLGHGILAVDNLWAFYAGLSLIVLGVGGLKPNISTMVGGLYRPGDPLRDKGFTIFYIGINIGAFFASLIVAVVAAEYGWHYGFGLAGIGMLIGQIVFMAGQGYLKGVGEHIAPIKDASNRVVEAAPMTKVEKDRMIVLFLSFLIVIVFWGAFEQAGGLMNIYAQQKVDRMLVIPFLNIDYEVPAGAFQAFNPLFIMIFGTIVGAYWYNRKIKGKESSALFKMAIGTMVMGSGFILMVGASLDVDASPDNKAAMYWLVGAYLLHTIGELSVSPVALSFITKLAPVKYASLMMGVYFATSGVGNYVAGLLGVLAQDLGEMQIFGMIAAFTIVFGIVVLLFLRKLKALTHGAEEEDEAEH